MMLLTVAPDVPHSVAAGEAGASGKIRGPIEIEIGAPAQACTPIEIEIHGPIEISASIQASTS